MKKFTCLLFFSFICLFVFAAQASAFLCVNDDFDPGFDFQAKLDSVTPSDNEVRLKQGTYDIADSATGHFNIETSHSLTISGGWIDNDCTVQTDDPELTILQGGATQIDLGGGVLHVVVMDNSSPAAVSISNMTIQNGSAELDGGGLSIEHNLTGGTVALATVNITDIIVQSNTTTSSFGSGIAVFDWGTDGGMNVNITDCIVQNNTVPSESLAGPGGIYIDNFGAALEVVISRCQILNNFGELDGGGLYIDTSSGNATLVNNIIAGNSVSEDGGGGIYIINTIYNTGGGNFTLTNNTITGNETTGSELDLRDGGGLFVEYDNPASIVNIYNNLLSGNSAEADDGKGDDLYILNQDVQVNLFNNNFNSAAPAGFFISDGTNFFSGNNVNFDPLFACTESNNYHLTSLSPVLDLGSNTAPAVPTDDLDGLPRPFNSIVDMGAYEFQNTRPILPGDINDDGEVTLQDALLGAQVLAGITPDAPICKNSDINNEGIIGGDDILFILQKISGLEK